MAKIICLILFCVFYLSQNSHGEKNSSRGDGGFGYEMLQFQFDDFRNSLNDISKKMVENNANQIEISNELAQVKDSVKMSIEKQTSLMQQLLTIISKSNRILEGTSNQQQQCVSPDSTGLHRLTCDSCPTAITVYCERESFGGGWIVVQQRLDGSENFTRSWPEYRDGFGTVGKFREFWLGLESMHQITNSGSYELAVELKTAGKYGYARYSHFRIAGEKEKYQISHLGEYTGTVQDQLSYHKGAKFSTFDQDSDESGGNCSLDSNSGGGWWYKKCANSVLNGAYIQNKAGYGVYWANFTKAATFSRMMIRRSRSNNVSVKF